MPPRHRIVAGIGIELLVLGLIAMVFTGCTVTLISSYDETTDKGVTDLQKSVDALVAQLDQSSVPDYTGTKKSYDGIRSDLNSLRLRNEARPKNSLTVKQLDELRAILDGIETQHKAGAFNQPMVAPTRDALNRTFRAILKLELEKKALDKKE